MKLIDLLLDGSTYRFKRDDDGDIWIYDDSHGLCATVDKHGEWIEYHIFDPDDCGAKLIPIDMAALHQLENIVGKIAEDLED